MSTLFQELLGRKAHPDRVLGSAAPRVRHGPIQRLPEPLRSDPLTSIDALCAAYTGPIQAAAGSVAQGVQIPLSARPEALLAMGLTVYFSDLATLGSDHAEWVGRLERELGIAPGSVALMAFSNAPGSGLPVHHDHFDQILIQLVGRKRLDVLENPWTAHPAQRFRPEEHPPAEFGLAYQDGFPDRSEEVVDQLQTLWLEPGSVLYLPAGCVHASAGQEEPTLTVVLQFRVPTRVELLTHFLAHWLAQDPAWRERPYGGWRDGDPALRELTDGLAAALPGLDLSDAFAAWTLTQSGLVSAAVDRRRWERLIRLPDARCTVRELAANRHIEVSVRCGVLRVPRHSDRFAVPEDRAPALEWILASTRAITRTELRERFELDDEALDALIDRLIEARVLRPIPVPPI